MEAVLEEPNALPGAEGETAVRYGDRKGGAGETALDMAGHVVGAFLCVAEVWTPRLAVIRDNAIEMDFHVVEDVWVGVFAYGTAKGVRWHVRGVTRFGLCQLVMFRLGELTGSIGSKWRAGCGRCVLCNVWGAS